MSFALINDRFPGNAASANDAFDTNRRTVESGIARGSGPAFARSIGNEPRGILRHGAWDALFIGLALAHGVLLLLAPSVSLIALAFWWNANTIAHNFIHCPFFRSRTWNAVFSVCLTMLLAVPQRLWRDRHLAHHTGRPWRWRWSRQLVFEMVCVSGLWTILLVSAPMFLLTVYLPGILIGLGLCQLQGHFEHERGTTSHYGRIYNFL